MWFFSPLFSRFKTMTLCRSRGELGGARRRDEQSQYRLVCSVGRSRFFSGGRSIISVCKPVLSKVEGLLPDTGPFPPEADQPRAEPDSALERSPLDRSYT